MNKEQQFQVKINELRALAKEQNMRVSTSQIEELFSEIGMPKELLGPVYDYLKAKNIAIDDEIIDTDAIMDEEDRNYLDLYLCELVNLTSIRRVKRKPSIFPQWPVIRRARRG